MPGILLKGERDFAKLIYLLQEQAYHQIEQEVAVRHRSLLSIEPRLMTYAGMGCRILHQRPRFSYREQREQLS